MCRLALVFVLTGLVACQSRGPTIPGVVKVPMKEYVSLPVELTKPCDLVPKQDNTYGEAIRLANSRLESLKECNGRMDKIRALGK